MKFKVLEVYKKNGNLVVVVEHEYGKDKLGLNPESDYTDPETGKPKWLSDASELLERKYGGDNKIRKDVSTNIIGQELETANLKIPKKVAEKTIKARGGCENVE